MDYECEVCESRFTWSLMFDNNTCNDCHIEKYTEYQLDQRRDDYEV